MSYLLPSLLIVPLFGALIITALSENLAKVWALFISLVTLAAALGLATHFNFQQNLGSLPAADQLGSSVQLQWGGNDSFAIQSIGFQFHLGVDSISIMLVGLTVVLMPLALAASFESIKERQKEYYGWMLVLLAAMLGVFVARDLLLFYIFFELTLIPMFFIIGIWGGADRRFAAGKFFLFTFTGSVFTLAAAVYVGMKYGTFDIALLAQYAQHGKFGLDHTVLVPALTATERGWVLAGFLSGFAVKVPLFPVHTWLPLAHTEAPTAGSVILAGVLLKLGTYGLLRLAVPIGLINASGVAFPSAVHALGVICVIGIIYGALVAWVQKDIKKLVAYSSVSHLGFCVLGLVALNAIGVQGSVLYMINHGLSTGALFLCIGMIYDRYHTRDIDQLSGLAKIMPKLAFFFVFFAMSSIGLPGTNGFVSEFLTVLGAYTSQNLGPRYGTVAALGVILGAVYMLHMLARVLFGPLKFPAAHHDGDELAADSHASHGHDAHAPASNDINGREITILIPLAILVLVLGVFPSSFLRPILEPVQLIFNPVAMSDKNGVVSSGVADTASQTADPIRVAEVGR